MSARLKRGLCVGILQSTLVFSLGCWNDSGTEPETEPTLPFAGERVGIAVPAELEVRDRWEILFDEWAAQTGARPQLSEYHFTGDGAEDRGSRIEDRDGDRLSSILNPPSSRVSAPALLFFPTTQLGELTAADLLAPIPESQRSLDRLDWTDFFQGLRDNVASVDGRATVVPLSSPVFICYYRRDLLDRAGLAPPRTWDDYQRLLETLDEWAPGMTAVEPWGENDRATMFLARAVSFAKHPGNFSLFFDIDTGTPLIDGPGFVRALQDARKAIPKMPPEVRRYTPADCRRDFLTGKAALAIAFETGPLISRAPHPLFTSKKDRGEEEMRSGGDEEWLRADGVQAGFCRLPGSPEVYNRSTLSWESPPNGRINRVTLTGFRGLCAGVSSASPPAEQQAAWNLLTTLAVENLEAAFPKPAITLCRRSHLSTPETWAGEELSPTESRDYAQAVADSLRDIRLVAEIPVVERARFRSALGRGVGRVLSGEAAPQQALSDVAQKWAEIVEAVGSDTLLKSYRRSLGLPPLPLSQRR